MPFASSESMSLLLTSQGLVFYGIDVGGHGCPRFLATAHVTVDVADHPFAVVGAFQQE